MKNALVFRILEEFLIKVSGIDLPLSLQKLIDIVASMSMTVAIFSLGGILNVTALKAIK